jgi:hypothetical protein
VLLQNGGSGNYLTVDLGGDFIGARVRVVLPDGRVLVREGNAGSSYLSSEDSRFHFGLGTATSVSEIQVHWLNGTETSLKNRRANQIIVLTP